MSKKSHKALAKRLAGLESDLCERMLESIDLMANYVDPRERYEPGWLPLGGTQDGQSPTDCSNFTSEDQLTAARDYSRKLARKNPFAINLLENLVSYVAGEGHKYNPAPKKGETVDDAQLATVQEALESILKENDWCSRQQEIVVRLHRDGEVFIRKFVDAGWMTRFRFIEPYRISQPQDKPNATWGIETEPDDVETVVAYWIAPLKPGGEWERVDAAEIQHRKANVDVNVKRGVPTTWPVGPLLERVGRLMENMGTIAEIQTAIAMIRRHLGATKVGISNLQATKSDYTKTSPTGKTEFYEVRKKGAIIDASANTEYDFPPSPDVSGWIEGASFNLRAAAARICFPEFMLTSDASNSNYSSTMVAEGPAVRMFQRLQASMQEDDMELLEEALRTLLGEGAEILDRVDIQSEAPTVEVRDQKLEADTNKIYLEAKVKSRQTIAAELGLDYEQEQENIDQYDKDHPDEMQQAKIAALSMKAVPSADQSNVAGRGKAIEHAMESLQRFMGGGA